MFRQPPASPQSLPKSLERRRCNMTRLDLINKMLLVVVTVESNTGGWAPTEANLIPSSSCIGAICRDYQTSSLQLRGGGACFPFQPRPPARDIDNLNNMLLKASASGSTKMVGAVNFLQCPLGPRSAYEHRAVHTHTHMSTSRFICMYGDVLLRLSMLGRYCPYFIQTVGAGEKAD